MKNKNKRKKLFNKFIKNIILLAGNYLSKITLGGLCSSEVPCKNVTSCEKLIEYDEKSTFELVKFTRFYAFR